VTTLAALDREWTTLRTSPAARSSLLRWARAEPALTGLDDLDRVLELRLNPSLAPRILKALAGFAPRDPLAARTLLQALVPGLSNLARTIGYDDRAALDEMVSLAYERIRTYPASRDGSVAGNVLLDVRKAYRQHRRIEKPAVPSPAGRAASSPSAEEHVLRYSVVTELAAARRRGIVSDSALRLIVRTRLADEPLEHIAVEQQVNVHCLVARRSRAERRLRSCLEPVA
jgi:hypothetical protein